MTTEQLSYIVQVQDRDLQRLRRELKLTQKALGRDMAGASANASRGMNRLGISMGSVARVAKIAAIGVAAVGVSIAGAAVKAVKLASDAAEVQSKMEVIYGKTLPSVVKELDKFSRATGTSRYQLREQVADMGALLKPMIGNTKAAARMSLGFVKLATDMGSFNNASPAEVLTAIRSGVIGEYEPLRRYGIILSEATVKQEAYRLGLAKEGATLTDLQKIRARESLIMKQSKLAQGDATRTAGSMANQLKRLKSVISDTATDIGVKLIPIALAVVTAINNNWPKIQEIAGQVLSTLGSLWNSVEGSVLAAKDAFVAIVVAISSTVQWLKEHKTTATILIAVLAGVTAGTLAYTTAVMGVSVALKAWALAQALVNAVLNANKVVFVISAIVALGAALVVAYKRSETFRNVVNAVWASVRSSAQAVATWYQTNLAPTIAAVLNTLIASWNKVRNAVQTVSAFIERIWSSHGATILRIVRAFMTPILTIVKTALANIRDAVAFMLAIIRGDWSKAWELLKGIVTRTLSAVIGIIRNAAGMMRSAAMAIGKAVVEGIWQGVLNLKGWLLDKVGGFAGEIVGKFQNVLSIFSPSRVMAEKVGSPIALGIVAGILKQQVAVAMAAEKVAQVAVDRAKAVASRMRDAFSAQFSGFRVYADRAFQAKQGAAQTPSEKAIQQIQDAQEAASLQKALTSARASKATQEAQLAAAQTEEDRQKLRADIVQSEEDIQAALTNITLANLRKRADEERKQLEARQFVEEQNYQKRLSALQAYLSSGNVSAKEAARLVNAFLTSFAIDQSRAGELVGIAFAQGMKNSIPRVIDAAAAITKAASGQKAAEQNLQAATGERRALENLIAQLRASRDVPMGIMKAELMSFKKYHSGGIVSGNSQDVPIIAQRGEGVFTREQMAAMGGGTFTAEIPIIVQIGEKTLEEQVHRALLRKQGRNVNLGFIGA